MNSPNCLNTDEILHLQRWRKRVVRCWIATMATAVGVWIIASAFAAPLAIEIGLAALLASLTLLAVRAARRGACPRCGGRIRFEPRIELPQACPHCRIAFAGVRPPEEA